MAHCGPHRLRDHDQLASSPPLWRGHSWLPRLDSSRRRCFRYALLARDPDRSQGIPKIGCPFIDAYQSIELDYSRIVPISPRLAACSIAVSSIRNTSIIANLKCRRSTQYATERNGFPASSCAYRKAAPFWSILSSSIIHSRARCGSCCPWLFSTRSFQQVIASDET